MQTKSYSETDLQTNEALLGWNSSNNLTGHFSPEKELGRSPFVDPPVYSLVLSWVSKNTYEPHSREVAGPLEAVPGPATPRDCVGQQCPAACPQTFHVTKGLSSVRHTYITPARLLFSTEFVPTEEAQVHEVSHTFHTFTPVHSPSIPWHEEEGPEGDMGHNRIAFFWGKG